MTTIRRVIILHSFLAMSMVSSLAQAGVTIQVPENIEFSSRIFTPRDIAANAAASSVDSRPFTQGANASNCLGLKLDYSVEGGSLIDSSTNTYATGLSGVGVRFVFVSPEGREQPLPASVTVDLEFFGERLYRPIIRTELIATGGPIASGTADSAVLPKIVQVPTRTNTATCVG